MIITLKNADFSRSNIGTLDSYSIHFEGPGVTNSDTSVDRESNTGYTTTIVLAEGYELNGSITVTMGEIDITSTAVSGLTITIPTKVTGNVKITVTTKSTNTEPSEPSTPSTYTVTYVYVDDSGATVKASTTETVTAGTVKNFATTDSRATVDGYTCNSVSPTSATVNEDITVTYTYEVAEEVVLPTGNLMDVKSRLDANTEFVSGTNSTIQWGPFRGATPTVDGDCVKISCADATQSLAGIRMGVPASVSALPVGTKVKITFSYRHDESYTPANEYKFYTSSAAASFAYTTEWKQFSQTYTWNNDWDRLQISSATTLQKEAIFYVKDFCIKVVN